MQDFVERELGWEDEISRDSDFILLPDGDYDFTVVEVERDRFQGSDKLPPCWRATVHLQIKTPQGDVTVRHQLFLHTRTEGLLCAFFKGIGQRQTGEKLVMNWSKVKGSTGRAKIGKRIYNDNEYNDVKKFYEKEQKVAFTPGKF